MFPGARQGRKARCSRATASISPNCGLLMLILSLVLKYFNTLQDLFKLGDGKNFLNVSHLTSKEISSKLSELLNGELIEPVLRVWRAYKFSIKHPICDKRLICHLNQKDSLPNKTGLRPGVTKLSRYSI